MPKAVAVRPEISWTGGVVETGARFVGVVEGEVTPFLVRPSADPVREEGAISCCSSPQRSRTTASATFAK